MYRLILLSVQVIQLNIGHKRFSIRIVQGGVYITKLWLELKNAQFNDLVLASPLDSISTESTIEFKTKKDTQIRWQNN